MTQNRMAFAASALFALPASADVPRVVTDIAPVHSLVAQVMGDLGTPELLVTAQDSPHSFALRPSQAQALEDAGLVVWIGHELTPWLEQPLETLASGATSVALLQVEDTLTHDFRDEVLFEEDHAETHDDHEDHHDHGHDEDHGDEHADHKDDHSDDHADHHDDHGHEHADGIDPHAWLDPRNGAMWLGHLADALATLDPENAATYRANADAGVTKLVALEGELAATLAPATGRNFVVFHDAYHYFEDRFGLTTIGALSLSDAQPPSPRRLQSLRAELAKVDCVFTEPQFSPDLVNTLLEGTEIGIATLDPLGADLPTGPGLYPDLLRGMATQIAGCRDD